MWINRDTYTKLVTRIAELEAKLSESERHTGWLLGNEDKLTRQLTAERHRAEAAIDNLIQHVTQGAAAPVAERAVERTREQEHFDLFEEDTKVVEKDIERIQGGSIDFLDLYEEVSSEA